MFKSNNSVTSADIEWYSVAGDGCGMSVVFIFCLWLDYGCRINVTVQLDTNKVRGFLFPAQAQLTWPSLTRSTRIRFPLTQIGNISVNWSFFPRY